MKTTKQLEKMLYFKIAQLCVFPCAFYLKALTVLSYLSPSFETCVCMCDHTWAENAEVNGKKGLFGLVYLGLTDKTVQTTSVRSILPQAAKDFTK